MSSQTELNVDVTRLPTMTCIRCGNYTFNESYILKKVSALVSPSGKETIAPIQIFTCVHCGTILPMGNNLELINDIKDKETGGTEETEPTSEEPKPNIVL